MNVLLIRPKEESTANAQRPFGIMRMEGVFPPLGLAYVAASLEKEGHAVRIDDCWASGTGTEEAALKVKRSRPDIVGITSTTQEIHAAIGLCRQIKNEDKGIITVIGGPHMSCFPKETAQSRYVDFGIKGEGEHAFAELAAAIEKGTGFGKIRGLAWKRNNKTVQNPDRRPLEDLDSLPLPARHLLRMERYHAFTMGTPMTSIIAGRGCPYSCRYCFRDAATRAYRSREPAKVVDEIEHCMNAHGVRDFAFLDDCWPKPRMLDGICREISARGLDIRWNIRQRADLINRESLRKMKKAGCTFIKYGVESGSERILGLMGKGTRTSTIERAFTATRREGIKTFGYFMVGYATETDEDFRATMEFAKKLSPDWAMFNVTIPFPDTGLLKFAVEKCGFESNYWKKWSKCEYTHAAPPLVAGAEKRCLQAYREFYFRPHYVIHKLAQMRDLGNLLLHAKGAFAIAYQNVR